MKGFILLIVAILLFICLAPIGFVWQCIRTFFLAINEYLFRIAITIDKQGNVICAQLFNDILIYSNGHKFGDEKETISRVLGRNKLDKTITIPGKLVAFLLDSIDKKHVENAANKS